MTVAALYVSNPVPDWRDGLMERGGEGQTNVWQSKAG